MARIIDGRTKRKCDSLYRYTGQREDGKMIPLHVLIVEEVLGRRLPSKAVIHHFDGNGHNNANNNLIVCPSTDYHSLLHLRQRALEECGNAGYRKCPYCKVWDDPINMRGYAKRGKPNAIFRHVKCQNEYAERRRNGQIQN